MSIERVKDFLRIMEARDLDHARSFLGPGFKMTFPGGVTMTTLEELIEWSKARYSSISKTFEGFAKTMFTTADNYVLQVHQPLEEPLRSLVVASALTVDTALKQDSRGFS